MLAEGARFDGPAPDLTPLNISPMQGARPIEWAAARGHTQVVDELIGAGADEGMVGDTRSPLALALIGGHDDIVVRLMAAGASVLERPSTSPAPIAIVAWQGDEARLEQMFDRVDRWGRGPVRFDLFLVTLAGRSESLQQMVLDRALWSRGDLNNQAISAFRWGDLGLFHALLERGVDPRSRAEDLVALLSHVPDPLASVELLVGHDVDVRAISWPENTALHLVTFNRDAPEAIRRLVELGVPIDARNGVSYTALHLAAKKGQAENVRVLLELGADATALDADRRTARTLWCMARRDAEGYEEIRNLLKAAEGGP